MTMHTVREKRLAWAVEAKTEDWQKLLGVYAFQSVYELPEIQSGLTIAVFKTRKLARYWAKILVPSRYSEKFSVKRIRITISYER